MWPGWGPPITAFMDGAAFRFPKVPPGNHVLLAQLRPTAPTGGAMGSVGSGKMTASPDSCLFGARDVYVAGSDLVGLSVALGPCLRIVGQVHVLPGEPAIEQLPSMRVVFHPELPADGFRPGGDPSATVTNGRFSVGESGELKPGKYSLRLQMQTTGNGASWTVESAFADGIDILDSPLVLTASSPAVSNVVVTISTRHSLLSGVLETPTREPTAALTVLAFATDSAMWRAPFRRVQAVRPSTDGRYSFHDLPPGEYYIAAVPDLSANAWTDPELLGQIVPFALKLTLKGGEHRTLDLRIAR